METTVCLRPDVKACVQNNVLRQLRINKADIKIGPETERNNPSTVGTGTVHGRVVDPDGFNTHPDPAF
jgi:hypothetical protein